MTFASCFSRKAVLCLGMMLLFGCAVRAQQSAGQGSQTAGRPGVVPAFSLPSEVYRTATGNDAAPGTAAAPKLTMAGAISACSAICTIKHDGDETISSDPFVGVTTKKIDLFHTGGVLTTTVDLSVPSNFAFHSAPGAPIAVPNTKIVSIFGDFEAGDWQAFTLTGTGAVYPYHAHNGNLNPDWWGAVGDDTATCDYIYTDNTTAIQAAVKASETTGVQLLFQPGFYDVHSAITLTYTRTQNIDAVSRPNSVLKAAGLCASFAGYILDKNAPANSFVGQTIRIANLYMKNTNAAGGCLRVGASGPPSVVEFNWCDAPRGMISLDDSNSNDWISNFSSCNSQFDTLAIGIHAAGTVHVAGNHQRGCYVGLSIGGPGTTVEGEEVQVSHYGMMVGYDLAQGGYTSSGTSINGVEGEGNDYTLALVACSGCAINGVTTQGSGAAPSGQSIDGVLLNNLTETVLSGVETSGGYSGYGCDIPNIQMIRVVLQSAVCDNNLDVTRQWSISSAQRPGVTFIKTNAPVSVIGAEQTILLVAFDFTVPVVVGDGAYYFTVPLSLDGKKVVSVSAHVGTTVGVSGNTTIQIAKLSPVATGNPGSGTVADILSTLATIEAGQEKSDTAANQPVINTSNNTLHTNDILRVDVDTVSGTPPDGLIVPVGVQ